jgi:hypothetical protein
VRRTRARLLRLLRPCERQSGSIRFAVVAHLLAGKRGTQTATSAGVARAANQARGEAVRPGNGARYRVVSVQWLSVVVARGIAEPGPTAQLAW